MWLLQQRVTGAQSGQFTPKGEEVVSVGYATVAGFCFTRGMNGEKELSTGQTL